ncbi:hypothetical protein KIW84_010360 [Lathyrus oleraceus]|uniref:Aminoacyl-tRNA synthetase class II (D/K/N) domain-containing protein n=1 Tax=Pisum sativum TaxID=3888 RepID=A0A9D4YM22_PEA|nr:hypothetical protein KIW84_010360 [Pisum sativum]
MKDVSWRLHTSAYTDNNDRVCIKAIFVASQGCHEAYLTKHLYEERRSCLRIQFTPWKHSIFPHAGSDLDFERLVQFATGMDDIRDVIPFPKTSGTAEHLSSTLRCVCTRVAQDAGIGGWLLVRTAALCSLDLHIPCLVHSADINSTVSQ